MQRLGFLQKIRKFQCPVFEKMLKTPFLGVLDQKGRFWTICGQKGAIFEFLVKSENVTFLLIFSFFNTKNQKTLMRGVSGNWARTDGRTDERTGVRR